MSDPSQFNVDRANPGRWTIMFSNSPINMLFAEGNLTGIAHAEVA
jgi:hypothetical protein